MVRKQIEGSLNLYACLSCGRCTISAFLAVFAITAALAPLPAGEPAPTFRKAVAFSTTGCNPYGIADGDLNNDGYPDIAVAACDGPVVLTLMNDQSGGFQVPSEIDLTGVAGPAFDLVSGNVDKVNSPGPDLVVNTILDNSITIMSNVGFGNFSRLLAV